MEGRYICPVCDQPLKMKHFCTYCKSFVKEPVYYNGPVPNESHSFSGRQDCMAERHEGLGEVRHSAVRQREYGHQRAGQNISGRPVQTGAARSGRDTAMRDGGKDIWNEKVRPQENKRMVKSGVTLFFLTIVLLILTRGVSAAVWSRNPVWWDYIPLHMFLFLIVGKLLPFLFVILLAGMIIQKVRRK